MLHEKLTVVEHFLKQGWDARRPLDGSNALNFVGGPKSAKVLIRAGVDPNTRFNSLPPLMIHASSSNDKVVDFLLGVGADPNCRLSADRYGVVPGGTTALMMAAGQGLLLIVRRLLDAGADINAVDDNRHNALFWCLRWDKGDVAKEFEC